MLNSLKFFSLFSIAASSMLFLGLSSPAQAQTGIKLMSAVEGCKERRHFVDVSAFTLPLGILDFCNGHTARGFYHYHARPNCLVVDKNGSVGQVLGYAFDGYPIVSPFICMARNCKAKIKLRSSYRLIDGTPNANAWQANRYEPGYGDLDECNGKKLPGGGYAYFFTERFPYSLACYAGEPQIEGNANPRAPRDVSARGNRRGGPGGGPRGERRRGSGGPGGFGPPRRRGGRPDFATLGGRPGQGGRIEPDDGGRAGLENLVKILKGEGGN